MLTKLTPIETASEIIYQRHIIQKLRPLPLAVWIAERKEHEPC